MLSIALQSLLMVLNFLKKQWKQRKKLKMHLVPIRLWNIMKSSKVTLMPRVAEELWIICSELSIICSVVPLKPLCIFWTEEVIQGLQQLGWRKVDVSFHSSFWPFFAHNNIHVMYSPVLLDVDGIIVRVFNVRTSQFQVKSEWLHNAGIGVIAHVADSLRQQEASSILTASL